MMKQYLKLLMVRESKEVLGKRASNLWLLTLVLVATFASIAFSDGSQLFLKDRMEDPFTNWVSIAKTTDNERFNKFRESLMEPDTMKRYGYVGVQMDQNTNYTMRGKDDMHIHYLSLRCFEHLNTRLVKTILDETNIVDGCHTDSTLLDDYSLGFIISLDAAKKMGYDANTLPTYIHLMVNHEEGGDSIGLKLSDDGFYPMPFPVIAVVKRLPNNVDMISSNFFYDQRENNQNTFPFNIVENEIYLHELRYFISDEVGVDEFTKIVKTFIPKNLIGNYSVLEDAETSNVRPWKSGKMVKVNIGDARISRDVFQKVADQISSRFDIEQVRRVHKYNVMDCSSPRGQFISIEFNDLGPIREFEGYAKENGVQLDMAQVASKENFQKVSKMAQVLSAAMVIFSIVCIIMFLVNMLQSYFQKVKRNLGTFKAFGINTSELIQVYIIILMAIVFCAVVMALLITWLMQIVLPYCGITQDGGFNYLSLWNITTYIATIVILTSTVITVVVVMTRMLGQTPGDLIYDRN